SRFIAGGRPGRSGNGVDVGRDPFPVARFSPADKKIMVRDHHLDDAARTDCIARTLDRDGIDHWFRLFRRGLWNWISGFGHDRKPNTAVAASTVAKAADIEIEHVQQEPGEPDDGGGSNPPLHSAHVDFYRWKKGTLARHGQLVASSFASF